MQPLYRFAKLLVGATFFLLVAGAMVTSTGSGLAVPDWPLAFGEWFPPMVGGVFYEHGHRLIASVVALLTLILCAWILAKESRAWVRRMALTAFGIVCLQALLGGLTVLWKLPPAVSIAHAGLAEIFFAFAVSLAIVTGPAWDKSSGITLENDDVLALKVLSASAVVVVYVQILLGALMRHTGTGISIHIIGAMITLFVIGRLAYFVNMGYGDKPLLRRPAMAAAHATGTQLLLGLAAWIARIKNAGAIPPSAGKIWLSTLHLAIGALVLAFCVTLAWRIFKIAAETPATVKAPA